LTPATTRDERARRLVQHLARLDAGAAAAPDSVRMVRAPGRVNLIGEHTDYNLGYVLPVAISLETWIASAPRDDSRVAIVSLQEPGEQDFDIDQPGPPKGTWRDYVAGIVRMLSERGVRLRGVTAVVDSEIPLGSGLSSSAALELAAAWTLSEALPPLAPMELARVAQRAENEYVGVQSGLMDQFASVHGVAGAALLFDCRSLAYSTVPLPNGLRLVAIDTRSSHRLASSEYNARRGRCELGVARLATRYNGVTSLRDVTPEMLRDSGDLLDDETRRRCTHVVEENRRVLEAVDALRAEDLDAVGRLFAESHASLRDLYEVSSTELDALVDIAMRVEGVVAARMTGAGFGGCTVNLVHEDALGPLRAAVGREYPRLSGRDAGFYVVDAVGGAGLLDA